VTVVALQSSNTGEREKLPPPERNWPSKLRGPSNKKIVDEENVRIALSLAVELREIARWNAFSSSLEVCNGRALGISGPRLWEDADSVAVQMFLQRSCLPKIGRVRIDAALRFHAMKFGSYHPIRRYLDELQWDGKLRLDTLAVDYWGASTSVQPAAYLTAVAPAWLISAVARVYDPGCQADHVIILEGDQGIKKSSALRILVGDQYFSDSLPSDLGHKDARDHLRGKWVIELSELAQCGRSEVETIKAFITRRVEQYRPAYGRHEVSIPRQCVFAGTTNRSEYLVDQTGNRRFWPIKCGTIELAALERDRDQIWAEVARRYRDGHPWHLKSSVEAFAHAETTKRAASEPWLPLVVQALELVTDDIPPVGDTIAPGELLERMDIRKEQRNAQSAARVGSILEHLGWERGRRHGSRGQLFMAPVREQKAPF
jgi:putative DNA primase/helicase